MNTVTINNSVRRVALHTLGCKLNFSETSTIARDFDQAGYQRVNFEEKADIYVINTCSVTENADKAFKRIVRQAIKSNPDAFLVAIGCYAQLQPETLAKVDGVDLVLGAREKFNILNYLDDLKKSTLGKVHSCDISEVDSYTGSYAIGDRTRAFLKIQDGCDYKCTYCTIPLARGISRSDSLQNILNNTREISAKGIQEIVLTGVNIGDYGKGEFGSKRHQHTFLDLVRALDQVGGIKRIRISSIEPNLLKNETIRFVAGSHRFVPHFHIPLQSGSDRILQVMKRRYNTSLYRERIAYINALIPNACIGVDVIVGFPGESDDEFLETYRLLSDLDISYLHVFSYSERTNTFAATMDEIVPKNIRHKRSKMLRGLSAKKQYSFYSRHLGDKREVLFEVENKSGFLYGFTDNYIRVKIPSDAALINRITTVILDKIDVDGVVCGRLIKDILL